jgi:hypothetical protein
MGGIVELSAQSGPIVTENRERIHKKKKICNWWRDVQKYIESVFHSSGRVDQQPRYVHWNPT